MKTPLVTAETLRHDRERRERNRAKLAQQYRDAADYLDDGTGQFRAVVTHLRAEAERWDR